MRVPLLIVLLLVSVFLQMKIAVLEFLTMNNFIELDSSFCNKIGNETKQIIKIKRQKQTQKEKNANKNKKPIS